MIATDGFDFPVGTLEERRSVELPPGIWHVTNPYLNYYFLGPGEHENAAYHTGIDVLIEPGGGCGQKIYACANGAIIFAARISNSSWGNLVIQHCLLPDGADFYIRYAHANPLYVKAGDVVRRGDVIALESNAFGRFVCHLHLDFSRTSILRDHPADWPGTDRARVERDYLDPLGWIHDHRPTGESQGEDMITIEQAQAIRQKAVDVVTAIDAALGTDQQPFGGPWYVTATTLNVRALPGLSSAQIGTLAMGAEVFTNVYADTTVDGLLWAKLVRVSGVDLTTEQWVAKQYLSKTRPT